MVLWRSQTHKRSTKRERKGVVYKMTQRKKQGGIVQLPTVAAAQPGQRFKERLTV